MSDIPAPIGDQITRVIDVIATGLDVSSAAKEVVGAFARQRVEAIREQLVEDARRGKIGAINLHDNPNVGGHIFRLTAAIRQGVRTKNIRLLARYFFGEASTLQLDYDACVEDATIIESLTDPEMRCLVIYQRALDAGRLKLRPDSGETPSDEDLLTYTIKDIDLLGYFATEAAFRDASVTLQRWGFVRPSSTWDVSGFEPTGKLPVFLRRLDLGGIIDL